MLMYKNGVLPGALMENSVNLKTTNQYGHSFYINGINILAPIIFLKAFYLQIK